jgi:magnesium chelatase family protein
VSIAHNGVLFLDELPEFKRGVLEALRQPLEDGELCIVRGMQRATFPSRVMLVASMNPCPCGWLGSGVRSCRCTTHQVMAYNSRVSGPLLDRIDLQVGLQAVPLRDLQERKPGDASEEIRARVQRAREVQLRRQKQDGNVAVSNANLDAAGVRQFIRPTEAGMRILELAGERLGLSARSLTRALKVARTIADLAGDERVDLDHIGEAIQYRRLDQKQI